MLCATPVPFVSLEEASVHSGNNPLWLQPVNGDSRDFTSTKGKAKPAKRRKKRTTVLLLSRVGELALYRMETLRERGFAVHLASTREEAIAAIKQGHFDVAVLSYTLPSEVVHELAERIRGSLPNCPLVAISDSGAVDRKIRPDETVLAAEGPVALIAALRRLAKRK